MTSKNLKRVATVLLSLPVLAACATSPSHADRIQLFESPKGAALRTTVVPGRNPDKLYRGVPLESPKAAAIRDWRVPGAAPDLIDRRVPTRSPRAEVNFPTMAPRR